MIQSSAHPSPGRTWVLQTFVGRRRLRPAGAGLLERRRRFQPRLEVLEDRTLLAINLLQNFPNITFSVNPFLLTPPDTQVAVGPNTVIGAVNTAITLTNKTGGARVGPVQFSTFFASIAAPGDGFADPQAMYDDQAGRFYVCILDINSTTGLASVDFAVSKTSSPTTLGAADWTVFPQVTSVTEGGTEFADFPKMGWNNDAVFISTNQFGISGFDHDLVLAISKASILAGGPLSIHQTAVSTGSERHILVPARMHNEAVGNLEYFVQSTGNNGSSTTVNVVKETGYNAGAGTFSTTAITVNAYSNSPGVPGLTFAIDDRILSVDWINNGTTQHMVAAGNVGVGGANLARWYEFNAPTTGTPSLLQQGNILPTERHISTSYPSIAINPSDSIAMTFLENGGGDSTSMYITGRLSTDPANTMQALTFVKAGVLPPTDTIRGGDYSATEYDPSTPDNFWSSNQFQFDSSGSNFNWSTQILEYFVGHPEIVITPPGTQSATEGASQTFPLGSFRDSNAGANSWTVDVTWGDRGNNHDDTIFTTTSQGSLGSRPHTYGEEGTTRVLVTIKDNVGKIDSASFQVNIADVAVAATGLPVVAVVGRSSSALVAKFTDPAGAEPNSFDGIPGISSHYTATISWGDHVNSPSTGTITSDGHGGFQVTGAHTYTAEGTFTITTTINHEGAITKVTSTATVKDDIGLLLLDPSGSKSLTVTGNGSVTATGSGAVVVDSNAASDAAFLTDRASVTAFDIDVTGGVSVGGQAKFSGPVEHEAATPDPLGLPLPPAPSTHFAAVHYSGSAPLTLSPGTYDGGIQVTGTGPVTLSPGVYYMNGGGFSVGPQGSVQGTGVLLVNAPTGTSDTISITGQATVTLTASSTLTGAYASYDGIVIFQKSSNPVSFTGGTVKLTGVVYVPAAPVSIDNSANVTIKFGPGTATSPPLLGAWIAFDLKVAVNGALTISTEPLIQNGDFEVGGGSFLGWTIVDEQPDIFLSDWYIQSGTLSPISGFPVPPPQGPTHAAMTDQFGPGSDVLYQDFVVPASVTTATLQFDRFIGNRASEFATPPSLDFFVFPNQQARVDIITTTADPFSVAPGDVLLNVFQTKVGDPLISGYTTQTTNVTAFLQAHAGQTLRLRFAMVDNEFFFQFGVDRVSLNVNGDPPGGAAARPSGRRGGDSAPGKGDLVPQGLHLLNGDQQAEWNDLSSVPIPGSATSTTGARPTVLEQLFSHASGGTGASPSGDSKAAQPERRIIGWVDPLEAQLVNELVCSLLPMA